MNNIGLNSDVIFAYTARGVYRTANIKYKNVEGYIDRSGPSIVLSFRGTARNGRSWWSIFRDILTDINCVPKKTRIGVVPAGFYRAGRRIYDDIASELFDKSFPVLITGHSLGGAVALVVAGLLTLRGYNVEGVVTFGSPRVGKLKVLDNVPIRQYKNGGDPITILPPFYKHQRDIINIGGCKTVPSISDHFIDNYILSLEDSRVCSFA